MVNWWIYVLVCGLICHRLLLLWLWLDWFSLCRVINMHKLSITSLFDDSAVVEVCKHRLIVLLFCHNLFTLFDFLLHIIILCKFSDDLSLLSLLLSFLILDLLFALSTFCCCFQQVTGRTVLYCEKMSDKWNEMNLRLIVVDALKILAISGSMWMLRLGSSASFLPRFLSIPSTQSWNGSPTSVYIRLAMYCRWSMSISLSTIGSAWYTTGYFFAQASRSKVLRCSN